MAEKSGERFIYPLRTFSKKARIKSLDQYRALYDRSISNPDGFWAEQAERITGSRSGIRSRSGISTPRRSSGSSGASSTPRSTAWTATWPARAGTRPRWSGRATRPRSRARSPMPTCTARPASSQTPCASSASRRAIASPSTCPWSRSFHRDAGLCAHRRDPQRGVRRLLRRVAQEPHPGFAAATS